MLAFVRNLLYGPPVTVTIQPEPRLNHLNIWPLVVTLPSKAHVSDLNERLVKATGSHSSYVTTLSGGTLLDCASISDLMRVIPNWDGRVLCKQFTYMTGEINYKIDARATLVLTIIK